MGNHKLQVMLREVPSEHLWTQTKKLPFKSHFKEFTITDPLQVYEAFDAAETMPEVHTIVVDTVTYLMDMYENLYVLNSANSMKA
mgnify:CR=1 FL=1